MEELAGGSTFSSPDRLGISGAPTADLDRMAGGRGLLALSVIEALGGAWGAVLVGIDSPVSLSSLSCTARLLVTIAGPDNPFLFGTTDVCFGSSADLDGIGGGPGLATVFVTIALT